MRIVWGERWEKFNYKGNPGDGEILVREFGGRRQIAKFFEDEIIILSLYKMEL